MIDQPICPECRVGKCGNCAGWALDLEIDDLVDCACQQVGHAEEWS